MKKYTLLIVMLLPLCFLAQNPIVKTNKGKVEGIRDGDMNIFKGIPFAAPPVGELRWKAPQEVASWEGIKKSDAFGPSPIQAKPVPFMCWSKEYLIPDEPIEEDCLYLNVWSKSLEKKKPVVVYIYGGGFRSGGAGCPIYDGTAMAKKDVVFVSINYRVGVFGFLAHPELTAETTDNTSGNYALLDMIAALKWVQINIESFGGDPNNVTIAGQSAGAFAVNFLTASPLATGLFHKAIAQSGGSFYEGLRPGQDLAQAEQTGVSFAEAMQAKTIQELRAKSAAEILGQQGGSQWPIIDGYIIPQTIYNTYKTGNQNDVPMLMGWNKDDLVGSGSATAVDYKKMLKEQYKLLADEFLAEYPAGSDEQALNSQKQIGRDQTFAIQVFTWAGMQTETGKGSVYLYNFNRTSPAHTPETNFGAFHSSEIPYVYGNLQTSDRPWEPLDHTISETLSSYWVNFAKAGNPNGVSLPNWESFNNTNQETLVIDKEIKSIQLPDVSKMKLWETYLKTLAP